METPYTQYREIQFRGPTNSTDYNARIEENYKDLVVLYNKARIINEDIREGYSRYAKDQLSLATIMASLDARITAIEHARHSIPFYSMTQIDNDRFNGTPYAIDPTLRATVDIVHGVVTLPQVPGSSVSKLYFINPSSGLSTLPSTLSTRVQGVVGSADDTGAIVDTSEPELSIVRTPGRLWERNIVVSSPVPGGASMYLYVKCPTDLFTTANSNTLVIHPFPTMGVTVEEIAYTTKLDPLMQDDDGYTVLNSNALYSGLKDSIGWVPPGGWNGDAFVSAGPKTYNFHPTPITGLRIKMNQPTYFVENNNSVYTYGLSKLDLLNTKFLTQGQFIVRYDMQPGDSANKVTNVTPNIWNIPAAALPNVFSYKAIYETSYNSGVYTTSPVAGSRRFWLQVNLQQDSTGTSPALSGLNVTFD